MVVVVNVCLSLIRKKKNRQKLANFKAFQIDKESFSTRVALGPVFKPLALLLVHVVQNYVISLNVVCFSLCGELLTVTNFH